MDLLEHQGLALLTAWGLTCPPYLLANSPSKAVQATHALKGPWIVKAQIRAGERGLGHGVLLAQTPKEVEQSAATLLNTPLVTPQTDTRGLVPQHVLVTSQITYVQTYYLAFSLNAEKACFSLLASSRNRRFEHHFLPEEQLSEETLNAVCEALGLPHIAHAQIKEWVHTLLDQFTTLDMTLLELTPFVLTPDNTLVVLDTKMSFDDNARYRQQGLVCLENQMGQTKLGACYFPLTGDIGCVANGAGLAMATIDALKQAGGAPANFLDVGGGASEATLTDVLMRLLKTKKIKCLFANIYGGMLSCLTFANALLNVCRHANHALHKPIILRLQGTHAEEAYQRLSPLPHITCIASLEDAVRKTVLLSKKEVTQCR